MGNSSEEMCVCQDMVLVIQQVTVTSVIGNKSSLPLSLETTSSIQFGMWLLSFKAQVRDYKFEQLYVS